MHTGLAGNIQFSEEEAHECSPVDLEYDVGVLGQRAMKLCDSPADFQPVGLIHAWKTEAHRHMHSQAFFWIQAKAQAVDYLRHWKRANQLGRLDIPFLRIVEATIDLLSGHDVPVSPIVICQFEADLAQRIGLEVTRVPVIMIDSHKMRRKFGSPLVISIPGGFRRAEQAGYPENALPQGFETSRRVERSRRQRCLCRAEIEPNSS